MNMQLQKLVFIAHGYHLAMTDLPLIDEEPRAWQYGPVFPSLYHNLRQYGSGLVEEEISVEDSVPHGGDEYDIIKAVWSNYGQMSGAKLSAITHLAGSPWDQTYKPEYRAVISDEVVTEYYKSILTEHAKRPD